MTTSFKVASLRGKHANAVLRGDLEAAAVHRRDLAAQRIEEEIRRIVAEAPPLTKEQRDHLARLLQTGQE